MSPRLAPYGEIELLKAEVNRLIELLLRSGERTGSGWHPAVDVMEGEEAVIVQVELPGVAAEELEVRLKDRQLSLRGRKRRLDCEPSARRFHLMERFIGGFAVSVELPELVDPRGAEARLQDGVLTVRLPRLVDKRHTVHQIPVVENRVEGREDD
jgi:HSP20 family protein